MQRSDRGSIQSYEPAALEDAIDDRLPQILVVEDQFNWKTLTTDKGTCKTVRLDIGDGVGHTASFQFKK